jgi:hypothetical protein
VDVGARVKDALLCLGARVSREQHSKRFVLQYKNQRVVVDVIARACNERNLRTQECESDAIARPPNRSRSRIRNRRTLCTRNGNRIAISKSSVSLTRTRKLIRTQTAHYRRDPTRMVS